MMIPMQVILSKVMPFEISPKMKEIAIDLISYLFIILFMYTAASKLLGVEKFASTLAKSPLIGSFNVVVAWAVPIVEIAISILLIVSTTRKLGLYASTGLMAFFTLYLAYMVLSGSKLPCNCGGVISTMSWQQHIWFNLGFVFMGVAGLALCKKK
jgi:hypothetical protein